MSKELPYFKFEPGEWQNGNIQMCSMEARISFIDICCTYWQRLGSLKYAFALQRHCNGNAELIQELCEAGVLVNNDGELSIKFLDSQLKEVSKKSDKAREAANKRWSHANAMQTHSERNAIREDKKREDKKRESKKFTFPTISEFLKYAKDKAKQNGLTINDQIIKLKYEAWKEAGWKDGNGNAIKNWKSKVLHNLQHWQTTKGNQTESTASKYDFL